MTRAQSIKRLRKVIENIPEYVFMHAYMIGHDIHPKKNW